MRKEILSETFEELGIDCLYVMRIYKTILDNPEGTDSNKLNAIQFFTKVMGLAAPDVKDIRVSGLDIAIQAPDDLDI